MQTKSKNLKNLYTGSALDAGIIITLTLVTIVTGNNAAEEETTTTSTATIPARIIWVQSQLTAYRVKPTTDFRSMIVVPGRSTGLAGQQETWIIDSSYNSNPASMAIMLDLMNQIKAPARWAVLGDYVELACQRLAFLTQQQSGGSS